MDISTSTKVEIHPIVAILTTSQILLHDFRLSEKITSSSLGYYLGYPPPYSFVTEKRLGIIFLKKLEALGEK